MIEIPVSAYRLKYALKALSGHATPLTERYQVPLSVVLRKSKPLSQQS